MPEIVDWTGRYVHPSGMHLRLFSGDGVKQAFAELVGWRKAPEDPGGPGNDQVELQRFPVRELAPATAREAGIAWAMANADEHGYPVVLLQDDLSDRKDRSV